MFSALQYGRHYMPGRHPRDDRMITALLHDEEQDKVTGGKTMHHYATAFEAATCPGQAVPIDRPDALAAWRLGGDEAVDAMCAAEVLSVGHGEAEDP